MRRRRGKKLAEGSRPETTGLMLIGAYKVAEGLLLLALGFGVLRMLHRDVAEEVRQWITFLRVDPENVFIHKMLAKLADVDEHKLRELSIGTFIYAGLRFVEGFGLLYRKRWAAYFTVIVTASFLPLEIWEIYKKVSVARVGVLVVNILIVGYLIWELRRNKG